MTLRDGYIPVTLHKSTDPTKLDIIEDYSGGAVRFVLEPDPGQVFDLVRLSMAIHDDNNDFDKLGNMTALTPGSGIRIVIENADTLEELADLTMGREILCTQSLFLIDSDIKPLNSDAGATRGIRGGWEYPGIAIRGNQSERLAILVPAVDFSAGNLAFFCFIAGINVRNGVAF